MVSVLLLGALRAIVAMPPLMSRLRQGGSVRSLIGVAHFCAAALLVRHHPVSGEASEAGSNAMALGMLLSLGAFALDGVDCLAVMIGSAAILLMPTVLAPMGVGLAGVILLIAPGADPAAAQTRLRLSSLCLGMFGIALQPHALFSPTMRVLLGLLLLMGMSGRSSLLGVALLGSLALPLADQTSGLLLMIAGAIGCLAPPRWLAPGGGPAVIWLGVTVAAHGGGMAETARAGAEAFACALVLLPFGDPAAGAGREERLIASIIPGAAGFLPLWLGLHAMLGLAGLGPGWTALIIGASLLVGWATVMGALRRWQHRVGRSALSGTLPRLAILGLMAVCPGALFYLLRPMLASLGGEGGGAFWVITGGDGGRWVPALATALVSLPLAMLWWKPAPFSPEGASGLAPGVGIGPAGMVWRWQGMGWTVRRSVVLIRRAKRRMAGRTHAGERRVGLSFLTASVPLGVWLIFMALGLVLLGRPE